MSHRFRVLDDLDAELVRVVARGRVGEQRGPAHWIAAVRSVGRLWLGLPAVGLVLLMTTIALAATGVILTGKPVPVSGRMSPTSGAGLPLPGHSRLLALRVADPAGGLPWGMRVVQTTRGLVCVQIGRVQNGQLGELGIDGAYHDDGKFHPVGPGVLPTYAGGASEGGITSERGSCVLANGDVTGNGEAWGSAVAAEFGNADENAAFSFDRHHGRPARRRDISYGILGPHAVSVTYREGASLRSEPVAAGVGAYLIVQPAAGGSGAEGHGEAPGTDTPGEGPGTTGALRVITYNDHGALCENGYNARTGGDVKIEHPCPRANPYPPALRVTPPGAFVRHPTVALKVRHGKVVAAELSFSAPFAVTSAAEGYSLVARQCSPREGGGVAVLDRNVVRGATVHLTLMYPFAARCSGRSVTVDVIYQSSGPNVKRSYGRAPGELLIGSATVRLPHGDRGAAMPRIRHR
jgi:hypothetical protein